MGPSSSLSRETDYHCGSRWECVRLFPSKISNMWCVKLNASGAAILAVPIVDTVKQAEREFVASSVDAKNIWFWRRRPRFSKPRFLEKRVSRALAKDEYHAPMNPALLNVGRVIRWRSFAAPSAISKLLRPSLISRWRGLFPRRRRRESKRRRFEVSHRHRL